MSWIIMDYYGELIRVDGGIDGEITIWNRGFLFQSNAMDFGLVQLFWNSWD